MRSFGIVIAFFAACIFAAYAYYFMPSVSAVRSADVVTVHFALLGDYAENVRHIDIIDMESGKVVWRVKASGDMFQLDRFNLVVGTNSGQLQPFWGRYQTDIPEQGFFKLKPHTSYQATVCFAGFLKLCRSSTFRF